MLVELALLCITSGPVSDQASHLISVARELNKPCLTTPRCASLRGSYFTDQALRPVMQEVLHYSRELNVSPYWFLAHIQEQSEFVSDAVSRFNSVKPNAKDPWMVPKGRKNLCGLDFGITQLHVPNLNAKQCTPAQVAKLRDPVSNMQAFGEWMLRHVELCRRYKNTQCRLMQRETGAPVMRRLGALKKYLTLMRRMIP